MRVLGYARISRLTEESTSIQRQRQIITQTCSARGLTLVDIVEDVDVSAMKTRLERPGLAEARRRIRGGEAAGLIVWRLDRLARSVSDFMALVDDGVEVISATEPIDTTTPIGRAMAQVLQVFAELESRTIGLRAASSRRYMAHAGRWGGGEAPYGYRIVPHPDGAGKTLEIDPEEAALIRRAAEMVLEGRSAYSVAHQLSQEGYRTRRGARWSPATLRRVLAGPTVQGYVMHRGEVVRDERGIPIPFYEPILTPDEVRRIRALLASRSVTEGRKGMARPKAVALLSGLLMCGSCGRPLQARRVNGGFYTCRARAYGQDCSQGVYVKMEHAERAVSEAFLRRWGVFQVIQPVETSQDPAELAMVEEAIQTTAAAMAAADADIPTLVQRLTELRAERDRLAALPQERETRLEYLDETFAERWEAADMHGRRELLMGVGFRGIVRATGAKPYYDPDRIEMTWRGLPGFAPERSPEEATKGVGRV